MKNTVLAVLTSGIWISFSEFLRNEILFKGYWLNRYAALGLRFPSEASNNAMWVVWSFVLAGAVTLLARRLSLFETTLTAWLLAFVLMWVVVWNLDVLPLGLLPIAVPWSMGETVVAVLLARRFLGSTAAGGWR